METQRTQDKDTIVLNPLIVNNLLALGYKITRVGKSNQDEKRTVFFFKTDIGLEENLSRLIKAREN